MQLETRALSGVEAEEGKLVGYAIVFNAASDIINERGVRFREVIEPQAVSEALAPGTDVRALIEHDKTRIIGRTKAGTLRYIIDGRGVRVEIDPPQSAAALVESVRRGEVEGMSFRFAVAKGGERWDTNTEIPTRYITKIAKIPEFSVVSEPAYPDTSVAMRSLAAHSPNLRLFKHLIRLAEAF